MLRCYDRVRVKVDKFLNLLYESNIKNQFIKSNEVDISSNIPCVFRGITRIELIKQCLDNNIEFFYIDTGYMGCYPNKKWHRLVKNNFQNLSHMSLEEIKNKIDIKIALNRFKEILQKDYQDFLVDYIEFTKTVTLADFISNLKIILSNILKDYETAFEAAKKINLEYPVGMNNSSIDTISTDLVYKGSKILAEEIFNLEKVLKSLSSNQFNYNVIYDAEKNKLESHSSSRFPLWLNNLGGLVFGFFLSLMIILFRYILKKNI
jgi:hypothetical protein